MRRCEPMRFAAREEAMAGRREPPVASNQPAVVSAWEPLRRPVFRTLWIASVAANVGAWMQGVAAAWLMTSLSPSPTLVALVQTATSLPFLIATLPAGALADIVDRRKLLIVVQVWMSLVTLALAVLTWVGAMTPALLLALTFALGLGWAVNPPIWQSLQPDLVFRSELAQAVTLGGINVNVSRAVGPALGGLIIAAAGAAAVFLINAATFLVGVFVFWRWRGVPLDAELPERLPGAVRAGLRYVRNEPALRAVLVRASLFMVGGSAIMALLPLVARRELGLGSGGYGILLGCFGAGAVAGAMLLPRFKQMASPNRLVGAASVVLAATTGALALVPNPFAVGIALLVGGVAWLSTMATLNTTAQMVLPAWVRARGLSVYVLVFQGCIAAGSAGWGLVAERLGVRAALTLAAAWLMLALGASFRWRLVEGEGLDLSPSLRWPEPAVVLGVDPGEGPVLVTVEYRVAPERSGKFVLEMQRFGRIRRRDGAYRWGVFRDTSDPTRYLETFLVASWAEHLRQHERVTMADRAIEDRVRSFNADGAPPVVTHLVLVREDGERPA